MHSRMVLTHAFVERTSSYSGTSCFIILVAETPWRCTSTKKYDFFGVRVCSHMGGLFCMDVSGHLDVAKHSFFIDIHFVLERTMIHAATILQ